MPLFVSDEDFSRHGNDATWVADKADAFIRDLQTELETFRAQNDAASITAEQTCSLLEQKYLSLSDEFSKLESQYAQLQSSLDHRLSEVAELQSQKHQLHLQSIEKDGEIERFKTEVSELHKSKRQLIELVERKDLEISEKNATIKSYMDRIVYSSDNAAQREARLSEAEAELARTKASCTRLSQEKELIERHNVWLNDELTEKVDSLIGLRKTHADVEADLSSKLADVERQFNECSSSLKWNKERVRELEAKLRSLQEELCSSKDAAAANEERLNAELSTLNKLVELYKESSEEWSKKAGELEGVIKALETHLSQVENDYKERLEREESARNQFQKMSDLIRRGRSMMTAPSSDPPAQSASAATAPALMEHVLVGPGASQAPASSASSVAQPASARRRHRPADTTDTTSNDDTGASGSQPAKKNTRGPCRQLKTAKVTRVTNSRISIGYDERYRAAPIAELHSSLAHDIGHVVRTHCPMQWKSWRVMPDEIKVEVRGQLSTNYNLADLDEESLAYVNRLFAERYKQWKSDLHHHFQAFDDPQVALQEGCPKELEGREDSWEWLCAHFQAPEYVNKAQVNKGNRKKKTLLHHSGSRPFSYRMDARRREGSKFPEIDVFGDVYVRPGNELAESLHTTMMERSQLVLQESASQLPLETPIESVAPSQDAGFQILTETLDQTLGRRSGTYCRGLGNARWREPRPRSSAQSNSQVTALTAQVAELQGQMSVILQSLAQSGFPIPHFRASTSQPVHPEHAHQTTAPVDAQTTATVDAQTSEPHTGNDPVDFASLFD